MRFGLRKIDDERGSLNYDSRSTVTWVVDLDNVKKKMPKISDNSCTFVLLLYIHMVVLSLLLFCAVQYLLL